MKKKWILLLLLLGMLWVLTGCFRSVDELYALPQLPQEYQNLQGKIEEITGGGAEYSAPTRGTNNQPVQLQDLDGDGELEAIAFFRTSNAEDKLPLKIYIFRQTESGYEVACVIEGEGSSISSIDYEQLNSSPGKELVVSWLAGGNAYTLSVYSIDGYEPTELVHTGYSSFKLVDLDMDNRKELALVRLDTIEGNSRVEYWDAEEDELIIRSSPGMSWGVSGLASDGVREGNLRGEPPTPALFVTSLRGEKDLITDIFAVKDGELKNVTLRSVSGEDVPDGAGMSSDTVRVRSDAKSTDINDDSVLEFPIPFEMPSAEGDGRLLYTWCQYDLEGEAHVVFSTYHNFEDGWYFILPESWEKSVTVNQASGIGEKSTVFSLWRSNRQDPLPFLTIYRLTGPNRHTRAQLGKRFILTSDDNIIYCAEFSEGWDCGLSEEEVGQHFRQTRPEW